MKSCIQWNIIIFRQVLWGPRRRRGRWERDIFSSSSFLNCTLSCASPTSLDLRKPKMILECLRFWTHGVYCYHHYHLEANKCEDWFKSYEYVLMIGLHVSGFRSVSTLACEIFSEYRKNFRSPLIWICELFSQANWWYNNNDDVVESEWRHVFHLNISPS